MKQNLLKAVSESARSAPGFPTGALQVLIDGLQLEQSRFETLLNTEPHESAIHLFLEEHPRLLVNAMLNGVFAVATPRSYLYSKVPLGAELEVDFAYCHLNSYGMSWTFIEIEPAGILLFTRAGDPTKELTHANRQITDWRTWMRDNKQYSDKMLNNLICEGANDDILPHRFIVIGGRRSALTREANRRRTEMSSSSDAPQIWTYDRLLEQFNLGYTGPQELGYGILPNVSVTPLPK